MGKKKVVTKVTKKKSLGVTKVFVKPSPILRGSIKNPSYRFQPGHPPINQSKHKREAAKPNLTKRLRELLVQPYPMGPGGTRVHGHKMLYADKLIEVLAQMGVRGEFQHLNMIFDRVEGKVPIAFHNTGQQAPAIQFNFAVAVRPDGKKQPPIIEGRQTAQLSVAPQLPTGDQLMRMADDKAPIPESDDE